MSRLGAYLATSPLIVSKSSSTSPCRSGMAGVLPVFASRLLAPLEGGGTCHSARVGSGGARVAVCACVVRGGGSAVDGWLKRGVEGGGGVLG